MLTNPMTEAVTFQLASEARAELDRLASTVERNRDALIAEAIAAYLDVNRWHVSQIEKGLRQAEAGEFATAAEIDAAFAAFS